LLGGFAPHIDSTAYTHIKNVKHLTILLAVDPSTMANGGLEVVDGSHEMDVPIGEDNCIEAEWVKKAKWTPVRLEPGKRRTWLIMETLGSNSVLRAVTFVHMENCQC
jgi:ectoine hydroxylase-related dioxygenase (phytanoyl-CoA dioxygenase family)